MKKETCKKKRMGLFGLLLVICLVASGCGNNATNEMVSMSSDRSVEASAEDFGYMNDVEMADEEMEQTTPTESDNKGSTEDVSNNRKLIKTAYLNLETLEYDTFIFSFELLVKEMGGYIESSNQSNGSYYYEENPRSAYYTVRVPEDRMDEFVGQVGGMGNIRSKDMGTTDVTLSYVDLESKRNMYEIEQDNLMELLDRAETVEDMIIIESRLTEIRYQLQSMESQLRTYDNMIDYATITISVTEVVRLEVSDEASIGERISTGFQNSMMEVRDNFTEFGIKLIINLPIIIVNLVIFAIFALIVFLIIKKAIKSSNKKHAKQNAEMKEQQNGETSKK